MGRMIVGFLILLAVAGGAFVYSQFDLTGLTRAVDRRDPVDVSIYFGGEKSELLRNPAVKEIIEQRYKITLNATKAGSVEMATTLPVTGRDCIWPSNAVAVELARLSGHTVLGDQTIFNSPVVFYAWADVADALVSKGIVTKHNDGLLTADVAGIADLIETQARWKEDLGLNIYGAFKIFSTHPAKSNSGNIWSGLLSTVFNDGEPPSEADLPDLLPKIEAYFAAMGHMEASSGDIFQNFLKQGMGARPIIVGYENQMVEFLSANARMAEDITARVRVIYPRTHGLCLAPADFADLGMRQAGRGAHGRRIAEHRLVPARVPHGAHRRAERSIRYRDGQCSRHDQPCGTDATGLGDDGSHQHGELRTARKAQPREDGCPPRAKSGSLVSQTNSSAVGLAPSFGCGYHLQGILNNDIALKFCKGAEQVIHQLAARRGGVDPFAHRAKISSRSKRTSRSAKWSTDLPSRLNFKTTTVSPGPISASRASSPSHLFRIEPAFANHKHRVSAGQTKPRFSYTRPPR